MPLKAYWAAVRLGGATGASDKIDGVDLADKDMLALLESTDTARFYWLDADASAAEGEDATNPDTNPGTKSWLLLGLTLPNTGLHLLDIDASHDLIIKPGGDLNADRTFTLTTPDQDITLDLAENLTVADGYAVTLQALGQGNSLILNESLTVGDGNSGTLTYSAASKTLTVENNAIVSQDYSTDGSVTFKNLALTIADGGNAVGLAITQNDVTNNPNALNITNTGTGTGIYVNQSSAAAGNIGWLDFTSTVTFGDITGLRPRVTANAASVGASARGTYSEVILPASKKAGLAQGVMAHVNVAAGNAEITTTQVLMAQLSIGASFVGTDVDVAYLRAQTKDDETIGGNYSILTLENQAIGGAGLQIDSAIRVLATNVTTPYAFDYGIDLYGANGEIATADIRLSDGATIEGNGSTTFTGATTENQIKFPDNLPVALDFMEAANSYMTFVTTNNKEGVLFGEDIITDRWIGKESNTFIGINVCSSGNLEHTTASEGWYNTFVGWLSGQDITKGYYNTGIGAQTLMNVTTGYKNTGVGYAALTGLTTGYYNMAIGDNALGGVTEGYQNMAIGSSSLIVLSIGYRNTAIGDSAGAGLETGNSNVFIGYSAGLNETGSNTLYIANTSTATPLIYGEFDTKNIGFSTATFGTNAANVIAIPNGTAPTADVANQFAFYAADLVAGNSIPYFRTENGTVIGLNQSLLTTDSPAFNKVKITSIGGIAIQLTNTTGVNTIAGQLVKADPATNDAVILTTGDDLECAGIFLDSGIADDAEAWVVVAGIADVAMEDNTTATRGNWVRVSITEVGYADATNVVAPQPINQTHFAEVGHCVETVTATGEGTHILARCVIHFN